MWGGLNRVGAKSDPASYKNNKMQEINVHKLYSPCSFSVALFRVFFFCTFLLQSLSFVENKVCLTQAKQNSDKLEFYDTLCKGHQTLQGTTSSMDIFRL